MGENPLIQEEYVYFVADGIIALLLQDEHSSRSNRSLWR